MSRSTLTALLKGLVVGLLAASALELAARLGGRLDSPPPMLALAVIIAAYWGATWSGLACAAVLFAYTALAWANPGAGPMYSTEMSVRLIALGLGLPVAAVLVGFLKNKADRKLADSQASEAELRALHDELSDVLASRSRILDQSMDVICSVNAAGQFVMVSAASEAVWGYTPEELIGRKYMDLVHPDDTERTTLIASKIIAGLHTASFINRYIRKDGQVRHIMWSSRWSDSDQLMYAVARDYTEQSRLNEERARYVAIIEATTDLVGMCWSGGRVSYLNKAGRDMLGLGVDDDLATLRIQDIYSEWAADLLTGQAAATALDQGVWTGESALQPRAGETVPVSQIVLAHRTPDGEVEFMSTIARNISTIKALEARLREEAATDDLSGLFNRRHFMERFEAAVHSARRRGHPLSFALCDVDGFKRVNDQHGHVAGDQVIKGVSAVLAQEIRGDDLVGRYGGDEFCIAFPFASAAQAVSCLERIRQSVGALVFTAGGSSFSVTMTFGLADLEASHSNPEMLMESADRALYRAKAAGRNRVELA